MPALRSRSPLSFAPALLLAVAGCSIMDRGDHVEIGSLSTTLEAAKATELRVINRIGKVALRPSSGDAVQVRVRVFVNEKLKVDYPAADLARDLRTTFKDGVLVVENAHDTDERGDWRLDMDIDAPARIPWQVTHGVGNVEVAAGGNDLVLDCGVGTITVTGRAGRVNANSGVGDVRFDVERFVGGRFQSGTGSVRLGIRSGGPTEELRIESGVGDVDLVLPAGVGADLHATSAIGGVTVKGATGIVQARTTLGGDASGRLGAGGPKIEITAGTGGVHVTVGN